MQQGNFERLKGALEKRFRESYPHCPPISDWKGQDIVLFQEELQQAVNGRVSEKWFYTHIKSGPQENLPRIDMLNMMSQYVGFTNWDHFCQRSAGQEASPSAHRVQRKGMAIWLGLGGFVLVLGLFAFIEMRQNQQLCFVDADGGELLHAEQLIVEVLQADQTPLRLPVDSLGCLELSDETNRWELIVDGPYYHRDTIVRLASESNQQISLRKDDYALMIHYFSTAKLEDWQKRKAQLEEMFADNARIFQLYEGTMMGMEMFNKTEFINKMITPIKSLRNIEILETTYQNGQIISLRFVQRVGESK